MEYADGKVKDLQIAYIGGGSRGWAWTFMTDLAMDEELSGTIRLYDIDAEAAKHNEIIGNRLSAREDVVGKWNYTVSDSLQSALTGADFIVISILPGTFDEMAVDVHMPERLGIYQSVGDTAGPGGAMRALRTIPMYVEIAQAIRAYAPKAWVINYTNPMSLCVKTLYYVFPEIKAFGCCHEVFGGKGNYPYHASVRCTVRTGRPASGRRHQSYCDYHDCRWTGIYRCTGILDVQVQSSDHGILQLPDHIHGSRSQ